MEIVQQFNREYKDVFTTKARYIHIWGGRGRGGSHFGTDYFLHLFTQPNYFRGYFMRGIFGDIKDSLWRDFKDRIDENDTMDKQLINLQENVYCAQHLTTNNTIISKGFKKSSGTQTAKMKSIAGATHVLVEEGEEVDEMEFNQMDDSLRTIKGNIQIIIIFNPPNKDHWLMKRWYNLQSLDGDYEGYYTATPKNDLSLLSIHSTYLRNLANINLTTRTNFENYRLTNFEYYATMIRGFVSEGVKGLIYKKWKPITLAEYLLLEHEEFYGQDFGYSADPAALVGLKHHNGRLYIHELIYETGLTNPDLAEEYGQLGLSKSSRIYADSAEPKSIEELFQLGYNVIAAPKGQDSVRAGINFINSLDVYYVETDTNLVFEKNNYKWGLDAQKNPTDKPVDKYNHLMDAGRYGAYTHLTRPTVTWGAY